MSTRPYQEEVNVLDPTFTATVRRLARECADRTALVTPTKSWTYAEVDADANRVAQGLRALGIGAGHRVGCLTKYGAECLLLTLGAMKVGAVCAPFNWRLMAPELDHLFAQNEIRFLLTDAAFLPTIEKVQNRVPMTIVTDGPVERSFAAWRERHEPIDTGVDP